MKTRTKRYFFAVFCDIDDFDIHCWSVEMRQPWIEARRADADRVLRILQ